MHILYFHQHFSTPQGAAGTRSYEMAKALIRNGHSVTMVCGSYANGFTGLNMKFSRGRRRGVVDGIDVIEFDLEYGNHMGFFRRIRVFAKFALQSIVVALSEPADLVFATTTPLTAGIPGIFSRWLRGKPFVFEVRDLWPELPKAMGIVKNPGILYAMSTLEWLSYRSATRLIGLSPGIVDGIIRRGVDRSKVEMIPNGCDLSIFADSDGIWRPEEVPADNFMAVFTGTHGYANGLDAVIDAAQILKNKGEENIKIVLIGRGGEKNRLHNRAKELGLENVIFLDPIPKRQLGGLLAGAEVGLQILRNIPAFYYGTSPNKFFDYIAAGLPVICNYPGWIAEIIDAHNCGLSTEPDNPHELACALISLKNDKERLNCCRSGAHKAAENFRREALADTWVRWVTSARSTR